MVPVVAGAMVVLIGPRAAEAVLIGLLVLVLAAAGIGPGVLGVGTHDSLVARTVVAGIRAAHFQGHVGVHVHATRRGLGVHAAVHFEGHLVHDVGIAVVHFAEPLAIVGLVQGGDVAVALGPVAGDVAIVARGVLVLVDADVVLDARHREARGPGTGEVLQVIVVNRIAVGVAAIGPRTETGLGLAGPIAGQQIKAEVLRAVVVALHRVGSRARQLLLDLVARQRQGLAVRVCDL